jgi:hypothetical protein
MTTLEDLQEHIKKNGIQENTPIGILINPLGGATLIWALPFSHEKKSIKEVEEEITWFLKSRGDKLELA